MKLVIPKDVHPEIIQAYCNDLVPMIELADQYGVTRQAIWKILNRQGIETAKGKRTERECAWCEKPIKRVKSLIRGRKHLFCDQDCYSAWITNGISHSPNRHGQRIGRAVVSQHFDLKDSDIVHHEDKKQLNNAPWNLKVFKDRRDHIHYHRRFREIIPLWDGSKEHLHI